MDLGRGLDFGCRLTLRAVWRQLEAMPCAVYLVRLIHQATGRALAGQRLWTAWQLAQPATLRFLRLRNREGYDVFLRPFAGGHNAGYILVDLDAVHPSPLAAMRRNGHQPCVVVQSSPGHQQVWIRVSGVPLVAAVATSVSRHLACLYGGDRASADAFHLGRLAGFTNQKPQRRLANGYAPWVRLEYAQLGGARQGDALVEQACFAVSPPPAGAPPPPDTLRHTGACTALPAAAAAHLYRTWLFRWRIPQRFAPPDWSIVDKWIAKQLLRQGWPAVDIATLLAAGSPGFPRRHADPQDYLRRTLRRAAQELTASGFSPPGAPCVDHHHRTSS